MISGSTAWSGDMVRYPPKAARLQVTTAGAVALGVGGRAAGQQEGRTAGRQEGRTAGRQGGLRVPGSLLISDETHGCILGM